MGATGWHTIIRNHGELLQVMAIDGQLVIRQRLDDSDTWQIVVLDAGQVAAIIAALQRTP